MRAGSHAGALGPGLGKEAPSCLPAMIGLCGPTGEKPQPEKPK